MLDYRSIIFLSHIILIGPLLALVGYKLKNKQQIEPQLYDIILALGLITIVYHTYKLVSYRILLQ